MEIITFDIQRRTWFDEDGTDRHILRREKNCLIEKCGDEYAQHRIIRGSFRYGRIRIYEVELIE
jgi:hypothetical protein